MSYTVRSQLSQKHQPNLLTKLMTNVFSGFMMGGLKSCATAFTDAALESTNPVLRRIFADSIPNIIEMAYELFLYSNKKQYYQVPQLTQQDTQNYVNGFAPIQGGTMMH
ncbi:spore coat protein [Paracerasibacillus soli]|uniref:spore coat protein n=1 Tax=Paracerasibacillus soli TaxID=480284 RepID=UPI00387E0CB4